MSKSELLEKYKDQSYHYFENALSSLQAGEAEKAGEFLWGSMAEALKAVAAGEDKELNTHGEVRGYARELAKKRGDESIWDGFTQANYLHGNFYEAGLTTEEVYSYIEKIRATVVKLLGLIQEKEPGAKE